MLLDLISRPCGFKNMWIHQIQHVGEAAARSDASKTATTAKIYGKPRASHQSVLKDHENAYFGPLWITTISA